MKKIISLFLSSVIIASIAVFSVANVSAAAKNFYANKKSVTVQSGKQKTITITSKKGYKLSYKISNNKVCTAKFGKWKGKKITLTIKAKEAGKTKITVTNNKTKKKIKISVTVKNTDSKKKATNSSNDTSEQNASDTPSHNIELPKVPLTIKNTYFDVRNPREETVTVSKIWTEDEGPYDVKICVIADKKDAEIAYTLYGTRGVKDIYLPIKSGKLIPDSVDYQYSASLFINPDESYRIEFDGAEIYSLS